MTDPRFTGTKSTDPEGPLWRPFPGPQTVAYHSPADELFYGGAAGGGKSDLLLGLAFTAHRNSIVFRREYPQLKGIIERGKEIVGDTRAFNHTELVWRLADGRRVELGAVQREDDREKYQGRPHDLKAFDELPHFTQTQYRYLIAWNRTVIPGQRCRVVAAGNPPVPGQGEWVIQEWAPWLDPQYPDPAAPGELRWYVMLNGELHWVPGPEPVQHGDETLQPRSRTFISARVEDNPALMATGYKARLQALPEPLRSQLLYGDFAAGAADDPWQVIPTAWVRLAMQRWRDAGGEHHRPELPLGCLGVDVSRGGQDKTVLAPRHGVWFAPLAKHKGEATSTGPKVAGLVMGALGESAAPVNIDCLSVGTSPLDFLRENGVYVSAINFGAAARDYAGDYLTDRSGRYRFRNVRAAAYWRLREALDPDNGEGLMLPDDRELLGDLCAQRYTLSAGGITLEDKDAVRERLGRSPDCSDAVALALWQDQSMDPLLGVVSVGSAKGWSPRV